MPFYNEEDNPSPAAGPHGDWNVICVGLGLLLALLLIWLCQTLASEQGSSF